MARKSFNCEIIPEMSPFVASTVLVLMIFALSAGAQSTTPITYLQGPNGCTQPDGYPDAALCVVPDEKPVGNFKPPKQGGSYIDPNFGGLVRIFANPYSTHGYSSPTAINSTGKMALINQDEAFIIVDVATGKKIRDSQAPLEGSMWDAKDENTLYFLLGSTIQSFNVSTNKRTTLIDYSTATPPLSSVKTGSRGDTSKDNWIPLFAPAEKTVCAVDLSNLATYCTKYDQPINGITLRDDNGGVIISKGIDSVSNKRYVILITRPAIVVYSVNTVTRKLDFEYLGPEVYGGNGNGTCDLNENCLTGDHMDTLEDASGIQYMVAALETSSPCEYSYNTMRFNAGIKATTPVEQGGGRKRIMPLYICSGGANWADWHNGCAKLAPYCVLSTTYLNFAGQLPTDQPVRRTPHISEVMVMRGNGDEIRRLAQHRSVPLVGEPDYSYWTTPRACISNDGSTVMYDTNFGTPNQNRVVLLDTGFGKTKISDNGIVNSASGEVKLSPGVVASMYGSNLANCRSSAPSTPLGTTLCGASVTVNGTSAPLYYASPDQINFYMPQATEVSRTATITVKRGPGTDDTAQAQVFTSGLSDVAPAPFTYKLDDGVMRALIQNSDYSLNGPNDGTGKIRPLASEETGILYATGLGQVSPALGDGVAAPDTPLSRTANTTDVLINNFPQQVIFAGLAPGFVGIFQINFKFDPATPVAAAYQLQLRTRGATSTAVAISLSR